MRAVDRCENVLLIGNSRTGHRIHILEAFGLPKI